MTNRAQEPAMNTTLIQRNPTARCYDCGSEEVTTVCHHCGRPLCTVHTPAGLDGKGRPESAEFTNLGLDGTPSGEVAAHCRHCEHRVPHLQWRLPVAGLVLAVLGFLSRDALPGVASPLLTAGILALLSGVVLNMYYLRKRRRSPPPVPLFPRFSPLRLEELVDCDIEAGPEAGYETRIGRAHGRITLTSRLGEPERAILERYRSKYRPASEQELPFHLGFAVLRGRPAIDGLGGTCGGLVQAIEGRLGSVLSLTAPEQRNTAEWSRTWEYEVVVDQDPENFPVCIVPYVAPESGKRTLELGLEWRRPEDDERPWKAIRLTELELVVPSSWGEVDTLDSAPIVESIPGEVEGEEPRKRLFWRDLLFTTDEVERCEKRVRLHFEEEIGLSHRVHGRAVLDFAGSLSGISQVDLHDPLGGVLKQGAATLRTKVSARYDLDLSLLTHQEVRIVPDGRRAEDRERHEPQVFEGVSPDHVTVIRLVRALAEGDYYVKSVVENSPRSGPAPDSISRVWDLSGRHYAGIHPVEFHLVLSGEQLPPGSSHGAGALTTTLTAQGRYSNQAMEEEVETTWESLQARVSETLSALARGVRDSRKEAAVEHDAEEQSAAGPEARWGSAGSVESNDELKRLRDALLSGRVSEEIYLELKAEIETSS